MKKILKIIYSILLVVYIITLSLFILKNNNIINIFNINTKTINIIVVINLIYLTYTYLSLKFKYHNTEYEFTSIINHTFRTPLTSILWTIKEMKKDISINEKLLYLQNMNNSAQKIIDIVDIFAGIKDINNRSGYVFKATSIRDIAEKSIEKYRSEINKKDIKFQISSFKDIPLLTVDLNKISFVIDTLIENAIFYTPNNGRILIDSIIGKNIIIIYISDTGIGLSIFDKLKIFSKFYRSKKSRLMNPDGLGLKLYLAKMIVKRHSGKIYARSNGKNKGSTFFVELPIKN